MDLTVPDRSVRRSAGSSTPHHSDLIRRSLPGWVARYHRADLASDIGAGLTVGVLLIPQAMAYALLGGLPPVVGLYAAFLPLFLYALLGTSRQLSVGPTAMDSLLVLAGASAVAPVGSADFLLSATLLAGLVGVIQFAMGVFRLGLLVNFLSRPVIGGFTSAAALVIAGSQINAFAGVNAPRANTFDKLVVGVIPELTHVHWPTLILGTVSLLALVAFRRWAPRFPGALSVMVLTTSLTILLDLNGHGVAVVGQVPRALPSIQIPAFDLARAWRLLPTAAMIALVGFMEAISVAKALAEKHEQSLRSDRELLALGLANLGAFVSGAYPVTGGFSRSAVADGAGARTQLAGVFAGLTVGATLLWLTPLLAYLPQAALAALVLFSALGLIRGREPLRLWNVRPVDALLWMLTFGVTVFVGIGEGILAGVSASLFAFIRRSTKPHTAELGRLPGTMIFRTLENFPQAEPIPGVLILRMDASLYFANTDFFKQWVASALSRSTRCIHALVVDGSGINDLDSSAEAVLRELVRSLRDAEKQLYFASLKQPVLDVLRRSGFVEDLGEDHFFMDLASAARALAHHEHTPRHNGYLDSARL